jgi:AraC family transcriptional regulator
MQSIVEGFSPSSGPNWRSWDGMLADVWEVEGVSGARGEYVSPHPRLFVVLDESAAGSIQLSDVPGAPSRRTGTLSYIPAGTRTWSFVARQVQLRHLDLHLDAAQLKTRFGGPIDEKLLQTPRLMFDDARLHTLAQLLAAECSGPGLHDLYGESLAMAMVIHLFGIGRQQEDMRGRLSPRRLRMATQYLSDNALSTVRLQDVAALVGLSTSYFCSAFKASTGQTPHQWQMQRRIERVKELLHSSETSLSDIAAMAGFADQAHMTRVFKQYSGLTPVAWLRQVGLAAPRRR